jgi:hypothetical protein
MKLETLLLYEKRSTALGQKFLILFSLNITIYINIKIFVYFIMYQFGGKSKVDSKRHFTVVMGGKEHGLYVSSTPSSAAKKAVTKLCAANKSKKVEFSIREITQGSKKKTYGLKKFVKRIFLNFIFYFTQSVK